MPSLRCEKGKVFLPGRGNKKNDACLQMCSSYLKEEELISLLNCQYTSLVKFNLQIKLTN